MDMNEIYSQIIIEHSRSKKHKYTLEQADMTEPGHNPSCGDEIELQLRMDGDVIAEAAFTGIGCAISQASASLMCGLIEGRTAEEAKALCETFIGMIRREITDDDRLAVLEDAQALSNVSNLPARVKCAVLAWHTLQEMIDSRAKREAALS